MANIKALTVELKPSVVLPGEVGLFAARDIKKGEIVCDFGSGKDAFLSFKEFDALDPQLQEKVRKFTFGREDGYLIDANLDFNMLPISHYVNHSCEGNVGFDVDGDLIALRDVRKGEEIQYDYGLVEMNPDFHMECRCNAAMCRKHITGDDWRDPHFQRKSGEYFHPQVRDRIK